MKNEVDAVLSTSSSCFIPSRIEASDSMTMDNLFVLYINIRELFCIFNPQPLLHISFFFIINQSPSKLTIVLMYRGKCKNIGYKYKDRKGI